MKMMSGIFLLALAATLFLVASCAAPPVKPPPAPTAVPPPAVEVSDCRSCHDGDNGDSPGAADVYEFWETSGHGRFVTRRKHVPECVACHDLTGAAAAGHLDGERNASTANTFHLVKGYLPESPRREWDVQVTFDNYCWKTCHKPLDIDDMRHERDGDPARGAVQMGQHSSYERVAGDYPMDDDLAATGFGGPPYFAPCISCHDPHGTGVEIKSGTSNNMVRDSYKKPALLCNRCHL